MRFSVNTRHEGKTRFYYKDFHTIEGLFYGDGKLIVNITFISDITGYYMKLLSNEIHRVFSRFSHANSAVKILISPLCG